jgi:23S rRNA pseudouridine1911/1915/1917 synthase
MLKFFSFSVGTGDEGTRLDNFLKRRLPELSRSFIKKIIESGNVKVDGKVPKKAGELLRIGADVDVSIPDPEVTDLVPEDIDIDIVYEDEGLAVVIKPAGMVVHPSYGHSSGTLVNALLSRIGKLSGDGDYFRPGIVHRLDRDTSGLIVVAKEESVHRGLSAQFAEHSVSRKYRGIVFGTMMKKSGEVSTLIGRHPKHRKKMAILKTGGRKAVTRYRVLEERRKFSLVEFTLFTGRTHQIRVHTSYLGHPIVGDPLYSTRSPRIMIKDQGKEKTFTVERNMLHAFHIGFEHPVSGDWMEFDAPDPDDFTEFWGFLS